MRRICKHFLFSCISVAMLFAFIACESHSSENASPLVPTAPQEPRLVDEFSTRLDITTKSGSQSYRFQLKTISDNGTLRRTIRLETPTNGRCLIALLEVPDLSSDEMMPSKWRHETVEAASGTGSIFTNEDAHIAFGIADTLYRPPLPGSLQAYISLERTELGPCKIRETQESHVIEQSKLIKHIAQLNETGENETSIETFDFNKPSVCTTAALMTRSVLVNFNPKELSFRSFIYDVEKNEVVGITVPALEIFSVNPQNFSPQDQSTVQQSEEPFIFSLIRDKTDAELSTQISALVARSFLIDDNSQVMVVPSIFERLVSEAGICPKRSTP